jgi:hypothetical protein
VVEYLLGVFHRIGFSFFEREAVVMRPEQAASRWEFLQAKADLPEVQAMIRREISRGEIRVVPAPGGGIRIIRESETSPVEEPGRSVGAVHADDREDVRKAPITLRRRIQ